jgi:hypothetical protein
MYEHLAHLSVEELQANLADPHWRIRNLYYIVDKEGNTVLFVPNEVQDKFLDDIWYRNVVPKARQRGFSTVTQIFFLDTCLFVDNTSAAVIAQDIETAEEIFATKIKFPYDNLPEFIRESKPTTKLTQSQMKWSNGSAIKVTISGRGGTRQLLHISEYGKICAKYPEKAREIQTGALPTVDQTGIVVIESTAEGREGDFFKKVGTAKAKADSGAKLSRMDFKLHFASWWDADEYETDPDLVTISPKDHAYFERIEAAIGRPLSQRKRAWWIAQRENNFGGDDEKMFQEYPSTIDEAFQVSTEGTYYAEQIARCRRDKRVIKLPIDPIRPVHLFFDLGVYDDIACGFLQENDPWDDWVDYFECSGEPYSFVVNEINKRVSQRGFVLGRCYLPHDGAHRRPGTERLKTSQDMLEELGVTRIEIVPRINTLQNGIDQTRDAFPRYRFDDERCKELLEHLEGYRKTWNERAGVWTSEPQKNGHQHAADMVRQHAQMRHELRMLSKGTSSSSKKRNRSGMAA